MKNTSSAVNLSTVTELLKSKFSTGQLLRVETERDDVRIICARDALLDVITLLRDNKFAKFQQLTDLFVVDYPKRPERFEVVYVLLSYAYNLRIVLKVTTDEATRVPSIVKLFSAATWYEREAWDLFGVQFEGNNDFRRLLTDYDFVGHPFRKDFPLTGYVEPRYDDELKRVVYDEVKLPQEYRTFDMLSPWEGLTPEGAQRKIQELSSKGSGLPGDEKATK